MKITGGDFEHEKGYEAKMHHLEEFLALKQGTMSVTEYRDRFLQLARYAPADVADDRKK